MAMTDNLQHFRRRDRAEAQARGPVDLDNLETEIARLAKASPPPTQSHRDYAPPAQRMENLRDLAVRTIDSFGELPTTELDEVIRKAKEEIADLEARAQTIRDDYVRRTDDVKARITRLTTGCLLAKETMDKLREQIEVIDESPAPETMANDGAAEMAGKLAAKAETEE